jgi:hypothetical protein
MDGVARQVDLGDRRMGDRISQFQKADHKGGRGAKTAARSRQVRPFGKRQLARPTASSSLAPSAGPL